MKRTKPHGKIYKGRTRFKYLVKQKIEVRITEQMCKMHTDEFIDMFFPNIEIPFDTSFAETIVLNSKLEEKMLAMLDPFRQETHGDMCMCAVPS